MEVILKQDVANLGRIGDLVKVKPGYARNYLLPRHLALVASTSQKASFDHQKRLVEAHKKKVQKASQEKLKEFDGIKLQAERRVNESGKMFGSVSNQDVLEMLIAKGHTNFQRSDIEMESVRAPGAYTLKLRLPGDVFAEIKLDVKGVEDPAEKRAKKTAKVRGAKAETSEETEGDDTPAVPLKRAKKKKSDTPDDAEATASTGGDDGDTDNTESA